MSAHPPRQPVRHTLSMTVATADLPSAFCPPRTSPDPGTLAHHAYHPGIIILNINININIIVLYLKILFNRGTAFKGGRGCQVSVKLWERVGHGVGDLTSASDCNASIKRVLGIL